MIRLADQYQVTRFMAAASSSFELLPLSTITQGVMLEVRDVRCYPPACAYCKSMRHVNSSQCWGLCQQLPNSVYGTSAVNAQRG